jgi:hypothetical protein
MKKGSLNKMIKKCKPVFIVFSLILILLSNFFYAYSMHECSMNMDTTVCSCSDHVDINYELKYAGKDCCSISINEVNNNSSFNTYSNPVIIKSSPLSLIGNSEFVYNKIITSFKFYKHSVQTEHFKDIPIFNSSLLI